MKKIANLNGLESNAELQQVLVKKIAFNSQRGEMLLIKFVPNQSARS